MTPAEMAASLREHLTNAACARIGALLSLVPQEPEVDA